MRVVFGEPQSGWLPVSVSCETGTLDFDASDIYPSLEMLIPSLHTLLLSEETRVVTWNLEPVEYDFQFTRNAESLILIVREYADSRRHQSAGNTLWEISGSYAQIALPFWRALRGLQGRCECTDDLRWSREFPVEELKRWTDSLKEQGLIKS